jgi:hypothetical protein
MVQSQAQNKKKRWFYDYNGAAMLAAPLLYCRNVPFTLFDLYSFGTFFHIYINICPPLFKLT